MSDGALWSPTRALSVYCKTHYVFKMDCRCFCYCAMGLAASLAGSIPHSAQQVEGSGIFAAATAAWI